MDESERLIALAALAEPEEAVRAWATWRATNDIVAASAVLGWAGGYIHRNLTAAGQPDSYLGGIFRYNWLANNRKVLAVRDTLRVIAGRWDTTLLKGFGMSDSGQSRGLRPIADLDFLVAERHAEAASELLVTRGFAPLEQVSASEFAHRIVPQRGSWNYQNASGADLDLHWRLLEHLDASASEALVERNTVRLDSEFGAVRHLTGEMMLISLVAHHALQGPGAMNRLFDIYALLSRVDVTRVAELSGQLGVAREVAAASEQLREILGAGARPALSELETAVAPRARRTVPYGVLRRVLPGMELNRPRFREDVFLRHPLLYRLWFALGRASLIERMLGPFTRPSEHLVAGDLPVGGGLLGIGWHYLYPVDGHRWANLPDARVLFTDVPKQSRVVAVELDAAAWAAAPLTEIDVFCNGVAVGRCVSGVVGYNFALPGHAGTVELSLRAVGLVRYRSAGLQEQWFRMLAPVSRIELVA
ncbi:MAG: nucleotidyltransferase family protein [Rhodoglobus sp.]